MKIIKNNFMKILLVTLFLVIMLSSSVLAQPDGLSSSGNNEGKVFLQGTVTKDITNTNDIFQGTYGTSTFTLGDDSVGLGKFNLQNGEIQTYGDSSTGYGNITANPAEIVHSSYNSSGFLKTNSSISNTKTDVDQWTVQHELTTDVDDIHFGTSLVNTNDIANAPLATRLFINWNSGLVSMSGLRYTFSVVKSSELYLNFGVKIISNDMNGSALYNPFELNLFDGTNVLSIGFVKDGTDWSTSTTVSGPPTERVNFDGTDGNVIYFQEKISDLDSLSSIFSFGSLQYISIGPTRTVSSVNIGDGSNGVGNVVADIFALSFTETPVKFGIDRGDQITTNTNDYVAINGTSDLSVRELNSNVEYVANADIDFITEVQEDAITYDDVNYRVTKEYEVNLKTSNEWENEVTLSNMKLYHVLDRDYSDYSVYSFQDVDSQSLILNEVAGDAITLSSIVEDTVYRFSYQYTLTENEYALAVSDGKLGFFEWIRYNFYSIVAWLGMGSAVTLYANKKKIATKTKAKNRR